MAKKTTRTTQQQRTRQEQWRRRVDAQTGQPVDGGTASAVADSDEAFAVTSDAAANVGYQQATIRPIPSVVTGGSAARPAARTSTAATATPAQRRALAATRTTRARLAVNTMSIEDEMHYVRTDIRKLITLTLICLAIIIVLSFILNR